MTDHPGFIQCWLLPHATIDGVAHIALRGINFQNEFDQARPYMATGGPWWHVPSLRLPLAENEAVPEVPQTLDRLRPFLDGEWPALAAAQLSPIDQDASGRLGKFTADGTPEPVARIAVDFGEVNVLPEIIRSPDSSLPYPRQPVIWVRADAVQKLPTPDMPAGVRDILASDDAKTVYVVSGMQNVPVETSPSGEKIVMPVSNLVLRALVAEGFELTHEAIFAPSAKGKLDFGAGQTQAPKILDMQ